MIFFLKQIIVVFFIKLISLSYLISLSLLHLLYRPIPVLSLFFTSFLPLLFSRFPCPSRHPSSGLSLYASIYIIWHYPPVLIYSYSLFLSPILFPFLTLFLRLFKINLFCFFISRSQPPLYLFVNIHVFRFLAFCLPSPVSLSLHLQILAFVSPFFFINPSPLSPFISLLLFSPMQFLLPLPYLC